MSNAGFYQITFSASDIEMMRRDNLSPYNMAERAMRRFHNKNRPKISPPRLKWPIEETAEPRQMTFKYEFIWYYE